VLAARGIPPRHERGWAARAVGLVCVVVLLIVLVVILQLVL
jgi:tetrahydromethanopterin S-methyltransferase subunit F